MSARNSSVQGYPVDGPLCENISASGSFSGTTSLSGTSGSATLSVSGSFSAGVGFCWDFTAFIVPYESHWIEFFESYSESISATVTAGASGFSENNFNSQPISLFPTTIGYWTFLLLVTFSVDLSVGLEYNITLGPSSSIQFMQGSYGNASQLYSWDTNTWTNTDTPTACLSPSESLALGCIAITTSNPFSGSAVLRIGPEVSLTMAFIGSGTTSVAYVTGWAFLYVELSLYSGVGNAPPPGGDWSGGQCGRGYAVEGIALASGIPASYSLPWLAICWAIGFQFGFVYGSIDGLLGSANYASPSYTFAAGPIATTVDVCDLTLDRCTSALTGTNPVTPDPSFGITSGATDHYEVISAIYSTSANSWIGGTWGTPTCGILTADGGSPYSPGVRMFYQAPTLPILGVQTCRLSFNTDLLFGLAIPSMQINAVTFDVWAHGTGLTPVSSAHFEFDYCLFYPNSLRCRILFVHNAPVVHLTLPSGGMESGTAKNGTVTFMNLTNGTYPYTLLPPPGLTAVGGISGTVQISGADSWVSMKIVPTELKFAEDGLRPGTPWAVSIDGVTESSTTPQLSFSEVHGTLTYLVDNVPGYYVTPTNESTVSVGGANVTVPISFVTTPTPGSGPPAASTLTFEATGLPAVDSWNVSLDPGVTTSGSAPTFQVPKGSYNFSVNAPAGYVAAPVGGTIGVSGDTVVPVVFTPFLYSVEVREVGLPSGTKWTPSVGPAMGSTTASEETFGLPNGTYTYSVLPVPLYSWATNFTGPIVVNGSAVSFTIYFTPIAFGLAVVEQGLPIGAAFSATVSGVTYAVDVTSAEGGIVWLEPNGTGTVSVGGVPGWKAHVPAHGKFTISGQPDIVRVKFTPSGKPYYPVTFTEKGGPKPGPSGLFWYVTVGSETVASITPKVVLSLLAGSYAFEVGPVPGYTASPASGTLTVSTHGVSMTVKFSPVKYAATFIESGLPPGQAWSVSVPGFGKMKSTTESITFELPNGTYAFKVGKVKGYTSSAKPDPVTVDGAAVEVSVTFTPKAQVVVVSSELARPGVAVAVVPKASRLMSGLGAVVLPGAILGLLAVVAGLGAIRVRRPGKTL